MNRLTDKQLRSMRGWSWGLTVLTLLSQFFVMNLFVFLSEIFVSVELGGDSMSPERSDSKFLWLFAGQVVSGLTAIGLQLASIRFGTRLARYQPRDLWWVVPQMVLVFCVIAELAVCLVFILFGQGQTALQLLGIILISLPIVLIVVLGFTIRWTRSIRALRQADEMNESATMEWRSKQGETR